MTSLQSMLGADAGAELMDLFHDYEAGTSDGWPALKCFHLHAGSGAVRQGP